jgi:tetratricopeptide (TPR) repeat protein
MSFLHEPGDLARTPLAALLLEAFNLRASGVLSVEHGGGVSRLFVRDGAPVGAQVFAGFRPLGHVLLQAGVIDMDALSRSLAAMSATGRPQGELLVEMGAASREQVDRALAQQQAGYYALIAALDGGAFRFDASEELPPWTRRSLLPPFRPIVDALERPQARALVDAALQPVAAGDVRLASNYPEAEAAFAWTPEERALVARLDGPAPAEAFLARGAVAPERARAMLAALLLLGVAGPATENLTHTLDLQPRPARTPAPRATPAPAPTRAPVTPPPAAARPASTPPPAPGDARRSDPAEARARRQRLLQRAMQNMGVGPFAGREPPPRPAAAAPAPRAPAPARDGPEAALRRALAEVAPRARDRNLFARLGIAETATRDDVKQAYLALAKQFHPDRFASPALADLADTVRDFFASVNEAYEALADDARRAAYLASRQGAARERAEAARVDFQKAEACFRTRDYGRARGFYETAIRADPRPEYQAALAFTFVVDPATRDRGRARAILDEALAKDPRCERALFASGVLARDEGDDPRAEKAFRAILEAQPRHSDALRELRLLQARRSRNRD